MSSVLVFLVTCVVLHFVQLMALNRPSPIPFLRWTFGGFVCLALCLLALSAHKSPKAIQLFWTAFALFGSSYLGTSLVLWRFLCHIQNPRAALAYSPLLSAAVHLIPAIALLSGNLYFWDLLEGFIVVVWIIFGFYGVFPALVLGFFRLEVHLRGPLDGKGSQKGGHPHQESVQKVMICRIALYSYSYS